MPYLLPRVLGAFIFLALCLPAYLYVVECATATTLYPGDQLEERGCRECGGSGDPGQYAEEIPGLRGCPACGGTGQVEVIIPGPNRPTRVRGTVRHWRQDEEQGFSLPDMYGGGLTGASHLMAPCPDGIAGAEVRFTRSGAEDIVVETNRNGRFLALLPPGEYRVTTSAAGLPGDERELMIAPLTEEIWKTRATILDEPESLAQELAWYCLGFVVRLGEPPAEW